MCVSVCVWEGESDTESYTFPWLWVSKRGNRVRLWYMLLLPFLTHVQWCTLALKEADFDCHPFQKCHALVPDKNLWHATSSTIVGNVTRDPLQEHGESSRMQIDAGWKHQILLKKCINPAFLWLLKVILFTSHILYTSTPSQCTPEYIHWEYTHFNHLSSCTCV